MGRLAVVGGNATRDVVIVHPEVVVADRHGRGYALPHEIDHEANMRALLDAGCDRVLAIGSVGGLQPQLGPGTFLCPDDFIALHRSRTSRSGLEAHRVPGFDPEWRGRVLEVWGHRAEPPLVDGGVYWQSPGPRLETAAEIRLAAREADVVGMTIASECVLAGELGLAYAAVCVVANYANGVGETELTVDELAAGIAASSAQLAGALDAVLGDLA